MPALRAGMGQMGPLHLGTTGRNADPTANYDPITPPARKCHRCEPAMPVYAPFGVGLSPGHG
jgi:hypothetical protein